MAVLVLGAGKDWCKWVNFNDVQFEKAHTQQEKTIRIPGPTESAGQSYDPIICVDSSYAKYSEDYRKSIEEESHVILCPDNIFDFVSSYPSRDIDFIYAERVMEHIPYDRLYELFYFLYEISRSFCKMHIIVPDFEEVFKAINAKAAPSDIDQSNPLCFQKFLIDAHTEIFNCIQDPHQSIWTKTLAGYYMEVEDYWGIKRNTHVTRDGRAWYLKIEAMTNRYQLERIAIDESNSDQM